jgi:predicted 3-demethylubiquinone-9 3-methyltransferase (glyoxalase superfamily)
MQKIVTFLMFKDGAEEAVKFYGEVFGKHFEQTSSMGGFKLFGQEFYTYNGGPHFTFTEGISLFVHCADQAEVDYYWDKLVEGGGEHSQCGWLQDRFGVSWQIIPTRLMELVGSDDHDQAQRATNAMLKMTKIDIAALEAAAKGE